MRLGVAAAPLLLIVLSGCLGASATPCLQTRLVWTEPTLFDALHMPRWNQTERGGYRIEHQRATDRLPTLSYEGTPYGGLARSDVGIRHLQPRPSGLKGSFYITTPDAPLDFEIAYDVEGDVPAGLGAAVRSFLVENVNATDAAKEEILEKFMASRRTSSEEDFWGRNVEWHSFSAPLPNLDQFEDRLEKELRLRTAADLLDHYELDGWTVDIEVTHRRVEGHPSEAEAAMRGDVLGRGRYDHHSFASAPSEEGKVRAALDELRTLMGLPEVPPATFACVTQ